MRIEISARDDLIEKLRELVPVDPACAGLSDIVAVMPFTGDIKKAYQKGTVGDAVTAFVVLGTRPATEYASPAFNAVKFDLRCDILLCSANQSDPQGVLGTIEDDVLAKAEEEGWFYVPESGGTVWHTAPDFNITTLNIPLLKRNLNLS